MKAETKVQGGTGSADYYRSTSDEAALQIAIEKWVRFQYRVWQEANQQPIKLYGYSSTFLRLAIIFLSAAITTLSDISSIERTTITIIGGVLTVLTGVEGYLRLADQKVTGENRRRELLAERDKWRYKWMVEVELESNTKKALAAAKRLLQTAPLAINDSMNKYMQRSGSEPTTKPK